jgi:hypothetical protein
MNDFQPLSIVSRNLQTTEVELLHFQQCTWIKTVEKNGLVFVSGRDAYKAKFILHLRRLNLNDEEIGMVLDERDPPYSLADVPKILGRPLVVR